MQQLRKMAAVITWSAGTTRVNQSFAGYALVHGNLMDPAGRIFLLQHQTHNLKYIFLKVSL